ncbi:MAG: gliding motility-associated C-terminal domain-containing protein [Flavobacteriales bacterium]|nr:gliding motility-associated C-terminal domain-containing protein [Flavobacteriales bacterium]
MMNTGERSLDLIEVNYRVKRSHVLMHDGRKSRCTVGASRQVWPWGRARCIALWLLLVPVALFAQEICNNGVDDDANGLVDLNDPACQCRTLISTGVPSFIPNPSFEELMCCPYGYNLINSPPYFRCAVGWQQATVPTTDLFNECGLYPSYFPIPPPDGVGFVGMRMRNGWQEYVGTCLTNQATPAPLAAGEAYTLSFHVAGTSLLVGGQPSSIGAFYGAPIPLAVYGLGNCVPFPIGITGCPEPLGWVELGSMAYHADGNWDQVSFTFTPDEEIRSIIIGTGCVLPPWFSGSESDSLNYTPYLLLDDLMLTNATDQVLTPVTSTGHYCTGNVVVTAQPPVGATDHQWYLDGVAIVGHTGLTLQVSALGFGPGRYTLASNYDGQCLMGSTNVQGSIVPAPTVEIGPRIGCAPLTVSLRDTTGSPVVADPTAVATVSPDPSPASATVVLDGAGSSTDALGWHWNTGVLSPGEMEGEQVTLVAPGDPGTYPILLVVSNATGCTDSAWTWITVLGDIEMPNVFSPNADGRNDQFRPLRISGMQGTLEIYNRWGQVVFSTSQVDAGWDGRIEGSPAYEGTYYYVVTPVDPGSGVTGERLHGHFMLLR